MPFASAMATQTQPVLQDNLAKVKLLLCDVDGVLTDATVLIGPEGESKRFNIQDGLGLVSLREHGFRIGFVSSRPSPATTQRAVELKIDYIHQARGSKVAAIEVILQKAGCSWAEVCYMGDDIVDLGPLRRAGVAVAVANAVPEAKAAAHYVTKASGGHGAVREVAEMLLKSQNKWETVLAFHNQ